MLSNDQLDRWDREHFFHPSTHLAQHARGESPNRIISGGSGVYIEDRDGKVLRLSLPQLSGEQRKKYAAKVKEMCEEGRVAMRNTRRDLNKEADAAKKNGELTEDENRKLHDQIQDVLKEWEKKLDAVQEKKIAEIMEV